MVRPQAILSRLNGSRLVLGGLIAVISAIISVSGGAAVASAATMSPSAMSNENVCLTQFKDFSFTSVKGCQNWWNQHHGGHGYGGNHHHHHRFHFHFHINFAAFFADILRLFHDIF